MILHTQAEEYVDNEIKKESVEIIFHKAINAKKNRSKHLQRLEETFFPKLEGKDHYHVDQIEAMFNTSLVEAYLES